MRQEDEVMMLKEHIKSLCRKNAINKNIPKYLYHFSDMENIIEILNSKKLYSRNKANELGLMFNDNASQEVIDSTTFYNKNYVRLYFRPRTPTQYRNEGVKSDFKLYDYSAHCPIPVFLLFSSFNVLSMKDTLFVESNLVFDPPKRTTISELKSFDFEKIYHTGAIYNEEDKRAIISRRHAEVLVKDDLDLEHLKVIFCRSQAEKETLQYMISERNIDINIPIKIDNNNIFFEKTRAFIDYVEMRNDSFIVQYNNFTELHESDVLNISVETNGKIKSSEFKDIVSLNKMKYNFRTIKNTNYTVKIELNKKMVYIGEYIYQDSLPF